MDKFLEKQEESQSQKYKVTLMSDSKSEGSSEEVDLKEQPKPKISKTKSVQNTAENKSNILTKTTPTLTRR